MIQILGRKVKYFLNPRQKRKTLGYCLFRKLGFSEFIDFTLLLQVNKVHTDSTRNTSSKGDRLMMLFKAAFIFLFRIS